MVTEFVEKQAMILSWEFFVATRMSCPGQQLVVLHWVAQRAVFYRQESCYHWHVDSCVVRTRLKLDYRPNFSPPKCFDGLEH